MNETERKQYASDILRGEPSCDGWLFGPAAAEGTRFALDAEPGAADAAGGTKMDEEEAAWSTPAELATGRALERRQRRNHAYVVKSAIVQT